jgi:hypothetical protein
MSNNKNRRKKEVTNTLVGFFVTSTEKKLIKKAKPEGMSMSEFCREIVLPKVIRTLTAKTMPDSTTSRGDTK